MRTMQLAPAKEKRYKTGGRDGGKKEQTLSQAKARGRGGAPGSLRPGQWPAVRPKKKRGKAGQGGRKKGKKVETRGNGT